MDDNEDTSITSTEEIKPKNPKRVEQGKRLAQWSRQAKQRRENSTSDTSSSFTNVLIASVVGITAIIGGVYLLKDTFSLTPRKQSPPENEPQLITFDNPPSKALRKKTFSLD